MRMRVLAFCVVALVPCAVWAQGPSPRLVLDGWSEAVEQAKSLGRYRMTGVKRQTSTLEPKGSERRWEVLRDGRKYLVRWSDGKSERARSFDGERWYAYNDYELGKSGGQKTAGVYLEPERSIQTNLDKHLESETGGGVYLRVEDLIGAPFNLGPGPNLPDRLSALESKLTVRTTGERVDLLVGIDSDKMLKRIALRMVDDGFLPTSLVYAPKGLGKTAITELSDFVRVGAATLPRRIRQRITYQGDGSNRVLLESSDTIRFEVNPRIDPAIFQLKFPRDVDVRRDEEELRPPPANEPTKPTRLPMAVAGAGIGAIGFFILLHNRRRSAAGAEKP